MKLCPPNDTIRTLLISNQRRQRTLYMCPNRIADATTAHLSVSVWPHRPRHNGTVVFESTSTASAWLTEPSTVLQNKSQSKCTTYTKSFAMRSFAHWTNPSCVSVDHDSDNAFLRFIPRFAVCNEVECDSMPSLGSQPCASSHRYSLLYPNSQQRLIRAATLHQDQSNTSHECRHNHTSARQLSSR